MSSRSFERIRRDVFGVVFAATGLFLCLALLTYHPSDFSWNSLPKSSAVQNACGVVGSFLADLLYQAVGLAAWFLVAFCGFLAFNCFRRDALRVEKLRLMWAVIGVLWLATSLSAFLPGVTAMGKALPIGGAVGIAIAQALVRAVNPTGLKVLLVGLGALWVLFFFEKTFREILKAPLQLASAGWASFLGWRQRRAQEQAREAKEAKSEARLAKTAKPEKSEELAPKKPQLVLVETKPAVLEPEEDEERVPSLRPETESTPKKVGAKLEVVHEPLKPKPEKIKAAPKTRKIENWQLPDVNLIENPPITRVRIEEREIQTKADLLREKLSLFSVRGEVVAARPGPAVTLFEFRPEADVKLSKITDLEDDLSLALSSESLRILAPIPGRDVVGVETSNSQREMVYLKDLLEEKEFWKEDIKLPVCLGKQVNGDPKIIDLRRLPHLMVAGTTGSGKSVFTVSLLIALIYRHSPKTLRLLLVDPKQVDLTPFESLPHLVTPIVTDSRQAVTALKWAVREMEKRYRSMAEFGARGLEDYNKNVEKLTKEEIQKHKEINHELEQTPGKKSEMYYCEPLPYMVIVVEEFADLMSVDKANVELSVVRLAQKARACGIHLVLCLQSPRREVVTGLIKSNIPGRIAFKAASSMESRIILDEGGAERLLAQGDMLFRGPGSSSVIRHHGPYLKDSDIAAIAQFWSDQAPPDFDIQTLEMIEGRAGEGDGGGGDFEEGGGDDAFDEKYDEILSWASTMKEVSASLIQRKFQLGYPRAARLIETFEKQGVVGPANGSKPRQVLVNNLKEL